MLVRGTPAAVSGKRQSSRGSASYEHYVRQPCHTPQRRHPASGYVQGINDLVTPFLAVFLGGHFTREQPMAHWDIASIAEETMLEVGAF